MVFELSKCPVVSVSFECASHTTCMSMCTLSRTPVHDLRLRSWTPCPRRLHEINTCCESIYSFCGRYTKPITCSQVFAAMQTSANSLRSRLRTRSRKHRSARPLVCSSNERYAQADDVSRSSFAAMARRDRCGPSPGHEFNFDTRRLSMPAASFPGSLAASIILSS
jgi:hypothetical protein